jgi:hypothetical protein
MPRAQLRSYPKLKAPERPSVRHNRDASFGKHRVVAAGPSIQNDLHTLPPPLAPKATTTVVRLRPAEAPPDILELRATKQKKD